MKRAAPGHAKMPWRNQIGYKWERKRDQ